MRKYVSGFLIVFATGFICLILLSIGSGIGAYTQSRQKHVGKESILVVDLKGVIMDTTDFIEDLREYRDNDKIKGILIRVDSPGGAVGASQELFTEIKRVREEFKKPVIVAVENVIASGAYYAAMGADQIVVNPGAIVGSIGVIMQFANLEKLYDWAKVSPYVIKTGAYKDSGASFRQMRDDERALFQDMIDKVYVQFKKAVAENRKLQMDVVDKYADGRVFTGEDAVELKFADVSGTFEDALRIVGELSGLGKDPEIFEPPPHRDEDDLFDMFSSLASKAMTSPVDKMAQQLLNPKLLGKPLYLMPSIGQ